MNRRLAFAALVSAAACSGDGPGRTVLIVSPASGAATNGAIAIHVAYAHPPAAAALLVGGTREALAPPFTEHVLDTRSLAEGSHLVAVEATWLDDGSGRTTHGASGTPRTIVETSAPVTVRVDRTPPRVARTFPPNDGLADPGVGASLAFSEPVEVRSFTVEHADGLPVSLGVSRAARDGLADGLVAHLPDDPGRAVRRGWAAVTLGDGVRDEAGNAVEETTWSFELASQPRVGASLEPARAPVLALDASGAAQLAFTQNAEWVGEGGVVGGWGPFARLARWGSDAWTSVPVRTSGVVPGFAFGFDVAFGAPDEPKVVAVGEDYALTVDAGSGETWAPVVAGGPAAAPWSWAPSIAARGGEVAIAWVQGDPDGDHAYCDDVRVARLVDGAWQPLGDRVNADGPCGTDPEVEIDGAGATWIAWYASAGGIRTARWDGAAWEPQGTLETPGHFALATGDDGAPLLLVVDAQVKLLRAGPAGWEPVAAAIPSGRAHPLGRAALFPGNGVAVAWATGDDVRAARLGRDGLEPLPPVALTASGFHQNAAVLREEDGTVLVAFEVTVQQGESLWDAAIFTHAFAP